MGDLARGYGEINTVVQEAFRRVESELNWGGEQDGSVETGLVCTSGYIMQEVGHS